MKMADRFASQGYSSKDKLGDRMIKQLLNSVIGKYRDLSVSRRSFIYLSLRLRQIIDLLATDKSRYFAQPRPMIVNYFRDRDPQNRTQSDSSYLMSPNEDETAVHGCHYRVDMVVRMRKVLAIPQS